MIYIKGTEFQIEDSIVCIGKFDGVHRGHRKLIQEMLNIHQNSQQMKTIFFTFSLSENSLLYGKNIPLIYTDTEKKYLLEHMGIDYFIDYLFDEKAIKMPAEVFINEILVEKLHSKVIVVGEDFRFGYQRSGDVSLLIELADKYHYSVKVIPKETYENQVISSSYIRENILKGNIENANLFLGEPYFVIGEVLHGNEIGRTLGMPTLNILPGNQKLLPPNGVYASKTILRGREYTGVSNIGRKPTIHGKYDVGLETYLFDFSDMVYGDIVKVSLYKYIRPEHKFASLEELKMQMNQDRESVRNLFY